MISTCSWNLTLFSLLSEPGLLLLLSLWGGVTGDLTTGLPPPGPYLLALAFVSELRSFIIFNSVRAALSRSSVAVREAFWGLISS